MTEYKLESQMLDALMHKIKGKYGKAAWCYKAHDSITVGIPDVILCLCGHFIAIEGKRKRSARRITDTKCEDPTTGGRPMQKYNILKINGAGGSAFIGQDIERIMEKLDKIHRSLTMWGVK